MKKQEQQTESAFSQFDPEKIKEVASNAAEEAAEFIRKHPFESVAGSLLVGLFVGLFINRNRK